MPSPDTKPLKAYYTLPSSGEGDAELFKHTLASAAQVLAANATPIVIIPAAPVGKMNVPTQIIFALHYHGDAYTADHEWLLGPGVIVPYAVHAHLNTPDMTSTLDKLEWTYPASFDPQLSQLDGFEWSISPTSAIIAGTSTVEVWAYYRQLPANY